MTAVLPALVPVGFIILIGFIAGRTLTLEKQTLSQLAIYILSPALIASNLYSTTLSAESTALLIAGFAITSWLVYLTTQGLGKLCQLSPPVQKSLIASTVFPNTGNFGLPFITFALGEAGLERAIVCLIAAAIILFCAGPALLKGGSFTAGVYLTFKLPLVWAMLTGLILRIFTIELPWQLDKGVEMLGYASIPIVLLILGMQLASTRFAVGIYEVSAAALRLLVSPLIAYLVGRYLLHMDGLDVQVLVLDLAMPTAVNTVVLVTEFGGDAPRAARTVVVSTLMSFFTLPFVLWASTNFG